MLNQFLMTLGVTGIQRFTKKCNQNIRNNDYEDCHVSSKGNKGYHTLIK